MRRDLFELVSLRNFIVIAGLMTSLRKERPHGRDREVAPTEESNLLPVNSRIP